MLNVFLYMASGRTLCEHEETLDDAYVIMMAINDGMMSGEPFWFGRTLVNPEHIEGAFASLEDYRDPAFFRRVDFTDLEEGFL